MSSQRVRVAHYGAPILSGLVPLALYVLTACRDIFWLDSTELMLVGQSLSLSHPPGYPLLTLLIRLSSIVPVLALPFRLNLVAALAAAGSCVMVYFLVLEISGSRLSGLFSALLWGVSFELWQQATALEVYALQSLLLSVVLLALVKWYRETEPRWLLFACFAFGLGLANHPPILLWVPSLVIFAWAAPARPGPRVVGFGLLLMAFALLLYLYVPLRSGASIAGAWSGVSDIPGFLNYVTARVYRYRLLAGGAQYFGTQVSGMPAFFGRQFLAAWLLVVPGEALLWRRNRTLLVSLLLGAALVTFAAAVYNIPDKEGYLLPAYLALLVITGCGFAALLRTRFRSTVAALGLALVALPAALFFPVQNRTRLHGLADMSHSVLTGAPRDALVFTDDYSLFQGLRWLQSRGERPDVVVVSQYYLAVPWYLSQLGRTTHVPATATAAAQRLWHNSGRMNDAQFGEEAKATSRLVMAMLVQDWLPNRRILWVPADFADWPQDWNGLRLTMRGLCYEIGGADTVPDFDSPLLPSGRYRSTLFRDLETQDLCRRLAATASRRGILQYAQDKGAEALRDFDLALEYFPDYPQAVENKGIVFYFSGQADSARFYLTRFAALDPGSPDMPKVRAFLARLGS